MEKESKTRILGDGFDRKKKKPSMKKPGGNHGKNESDSTSFRDVKKVIRKVHCPRCKSDNIYNGRLRTATRVEQVEAVAMGIDLLHGLNVRERHCRACRLKNFVTFEAVRKPLI